MSDIPDIPKDYHKLKWVEAEQEGGRIPMPSLDGRDSVWVAFYCGLDVPSASKPRIGRFMEFRNIMGSTHCFRIYPMENYTMYFPEDVGMWAYVDNT